MNGTPLRSLTGVLLAGLLAAILVVPFVLNGAGRYAHRPPQRLEGTKAKPRAARGRERLKAVAEPADIPALVGRLKADVEKLVETEGPGSRTGRIAGSAAAKRVAEMLAERFRQAGLTRVAEQKFPVAMPVTREMKFSAGGTDYRLSPFWPNLVRTCTLPGELEADLVWGGDGQLVNLRGKEVRGAILLLEEDQGFDWLTACSLGARAAIFLEPANPRKLQHGLKVLSCALDIPRFWLARDEGLKLKKELLAAGKDGKALKAKLRCRVDWVNREVCNVYGLMPGADPEKRDDITVVVTHYDSTSVVPGVAPGAEPAGSVAAVLELLRRMKENPPERSVLFLAIGAHYPAMLGEKEAMELLRRPGDELLTEIGGDLRPLDGGVLGVDAKAVMAAAGQAVSGMRPWQRVVLIIMGFLMLLVAGACIHKYKLRFKAAAALVVAVIVVGGLGLGLLGSWWGRTRRGRKQPVKDLWRAHGYVALRREIKDFSKREPELAAKLLKIIERREEAERQAIVARGKLKALLNKRQRERGSVSEGWLKEYAALTAELQRRVLDAADFSGPGGAGEDFKQLDELLAAKFKKAEKTDKNLARLLDAAITELDEVNERLKNRASDRLKYLRLVRYLCFLAELGPDVPERVGSCVGLDLSSHSDRMAVFFKGQYVDQFIQRDEKRLQLAVSPVAEFLADVGSAYAKAQSEVQPEAGGWSSSEEFPFVTDTTVSIGGKDWRTLAPEGTTPGKPAFSTEVFTLGGLPSVTVGTASDARPLLNSPLDLPEHMDFEKLARQVEVLCQSVVKMFHPGSPEVELGDVRNWAGLALVLSEEGALAAPSPARRVWKLLPAGPRRALSRSAARATEPAAARKREVVAALNAILKRPDFHAGEDFRGMELEDEAAGIQRKREGAGGELSEAETLRFNRLVLEQAFPQIGRLAERERGLAALERIEAECDFQASETVLRLYGQIIEYNPAKSKTLSLTPVPGAVVLGLRLSKSRWGERRRSASDPVRPQVVALADRWGAYEFFGLAAAKYRRWNSEENAILAFDLDPVSGNVIKAPEEGEESKKRPLPWDKPKSTEHEFIVTTFGCQALNVFEISDLRAYEVPDNQFGKIEMYKGQVDAVPISFGWSMVGETSGYTYPEHATVFFTDRRPVRKTSGAGGGGTSAVQLKFTLSRKRLAVSRWPMLGVPPGELTKANHGGNGLTVIDSARVIDPDTQEFDKHGNPIPGTGLPAPATVVMAQDLYRLDEFRLKILERAGVRNSVLAAQHEAAGREMKKALEAKEKKHWDEMLIHARNAWAYEARAYPRTQSTVTDVVKGLLFYLFLMLPFAYFMERLIFSFPTINKQLGGVFGLFMLSFLVLAVVHPAFGITSSAPMILLSFITIALAILVISMISSRFKRELEALQHRPGRSHKVDMDRMNAAISAFLLGINNMRRRKVRTMLTLITLVLLTFSVLSFSSIESTLGTNKRTIDLRGAKPPYSGVLVRNEGWRGLDAFAAHILRDEFARPERKCTFAPRAWWAIQNDEGQGKVIYNADDPSAFYTVPGILGVRAAEREVTGLGRNEAGVRRIKHGRWLTGEEVREKAPVCLLSEKLAGELKINKDRVVATTNLKDLPHVVIGGQPLAVIGVLDDTAYRGTVDIDGESVVPVDFAAESWQRQGGRGQASAQLEFRRYTHLEAFKVPVVPYDWLLGRGGKLYSVALVPEDPEEVPRLAEEEILRRTRVPLFFAHEGAVTFMSTAQVSDVSGMGSLIVPMLIAALIVLNTMLGSVYEREHEISIYGSLGLAPVHIGSLFIAESAVFAVVSAVLGYILGQSVSKIVVLAGAEGVFSGFSLNYSSLSAVFSACFIIAVVMLSAAYPAVRAGQLSVPDVERIWKFPEPEKDRLVFDFPFTVSGEQGLGVNIHLRHFFEDHANQSVGEFYTADTEFGYLKPGEKEAGYRLSSRVWIAPFDFGISQILELQTFPAPDEENIYDTRMILTRASGSPDAWVKMNHRFMKSIRKQFLLWRLFTTEERAWHVGQARVLLGETPPEEAPPEAREAGGPAAEPAPGTG